MRHKLAKGKLSRPTQHRLLMLKGATMDLLKYESIETTESKAREIKKMAEKANTTALSMIQSGDFGGSDPRTVLDTAYSTGVMLGKITEATTFETWAKKTLSTSKFNFLEIPEINQSLGLPAPVLSMLVDLNNTKRAILNEP